MLTELPPSQRRLADLLTAALRDPVSLTRMNASDLDLTIRGAKRVRLLGRLGFELDKRGLFETLPQVARDLMAGARAYTHSRTRIVLWELSRLGVALGTDPDVPCIAMKGCAYLLLGLEQGAERMIADVDLMFREQQLPGVESRLNRLGWMTKSLTPHDEKYYRKWSHELPPLVHITRETEVDLHHNILPPTARLKPPSDRLVESARPVPDSPFHVLADEDMLLHAMVHLMFSDEMADKLRDLVDIDDLIRHFASRSGDAFWNEFVERAEELDLKRPAFYSLRYASRLLDTPVPEDVLTRIASWGPPAPILKLMDRLVPSALFPPHPDYPSRVVESSRFLLYIRSHWIRMPPWLLAYHLSYKFINTRLRQPPDPEDEQETEAAAN